MCKLKTREAKPQKGKPTDLFEVFPVISSRHPTIFLRIIDGFLRNLVLLRKKLYLSESKVQYSFFLENFKSQNTVLTVYVEFLIDYTCFSFYSKKTN